MPLSFHVGGPWASNPESLQEGPHFTIREMPELVLAYNDFNADDIRAIRHERVDLALATRGSVIFVLYQITGVFAWSDTPFTVHLMKGEGERAEFLARTIADNDHLLMRLLAVDAKRNEILAMRVFTLSPAFMQTFQDLARAQAEMPFSADAYRAEVQSMYLSMTPDQLLKSAVVSTRAGD